MTDLATIDPSELQSVCGGGFEMMGQYLLQGLINGGSQALMSLFNGVVQGGAEGLMAALSPGQPAAPSGSPGYADQGAGPP